MMDSISQPIVVCGATGRVGSLVVAALRARNLPVRATGRPGPKLAGLERLGAEVRAGSLMDPQFLEQVFRGAQSAFLLTPVDTTAEDVNGVQYSIIDAVSSALAKSSVRHAVLLSSWGAELSQQVGGIIACNRFEQALEATPDLNVVHLRPVWFMDNFLWSIPLIQMAGINGSIIDGNVSFPMIAARDIAPVATEYLVARNFTGASVRYLSGPRDYSLIEVTRALGEAIGRSGLGYVRLPQEVYRRGLLGAGLTPNAAELAIEIGRGIESGVVRAAARDAASATPTTIEQFAQDIFGVRYRESEQQKLGARLNGAFLRSYLFLTGHHAQ
jgi:uncharacterized protein YbjT (DUF2867 family)